MEIGTSRFGSLKILRNDMICFPAGLPGFEDCRDWVLLAERHGSSVAWLQSTQLADAALPVVSPARFVADYRLLIEPLELTALGLARPEHLQVLVVVGRNAEALTLNLRAPLAINTHRRLGRQVINLGQWSLDHSIAHHVMTRRKTA